LISGSLSHLPEYPKAIIGDISAIMTKNMPSIGRSFYTPDIETAMLSDWDEKIKRITNQVGNQDVAMFGGVPTWLLVTFRELLKKYNKNNLLEIYYNLEGYLHGGVGFGPYIDQFKELVPSKDFIYQEIYNASEGFSEFNNTMKTIVCYCWSTTVYIMNFSLSVNGKSLHLSLLD
jgi:hypothetical protein